MSRVGVCDPECSIAGLMHAVLLAFGGEVSKICWHLSQAKQFSFSMAKLLMTALHTNACFCTHHVTPALRTDVLMFTAEHGAGHAFLR